MLEKNQSVPFGVSERHEQTAGTVEAVRPLERKRCQVLEQRRRREHPGGGRGRPAALHQGPVGPRGHAARRGGGGRGLRRGGGRCAVPQGRAGRGPDGYLHAQDGRHQRHAQDQGPPAADRGRHPHRPRGGRARLRGHQGRRAGIFAEGLGARGPLSRHPHGPRGGHHNRPRPRPEDAQHLSERHFRRRRNRSSAAHREGTRGHKGSGTGDERQADRWVFKHLGEDGQEPHLEYLPQAAHLRQDPGRDLRHKGGRHRRRGARVPPSKGTLRATFVPFPSWLCTSISPPRASTLSRIVESPTPARGEARSNPLPSSMTAASTVPSPVRSLTSTLRAPEWRRALVRASCRTRESCTLNSPASPSGNPSSTTRLIFRSGESCRLSSTSDSTDFTNGRSPSCLRSYMALRRPEVALPSASSSSSRSSSSPEFLACRWVSRKDWRAPERSWSTTSCRSRAILRRSDRRISERDSSALMRSVISFWTPTKLVTRPFSSRMG